MNEKKLGFNKIGQNNVSVRLANKGKEPLS